MLLPAPFLRPIDPDGIAPGREQRGEVGLDDLDSWAARQPGDALDVLAPDLMLVVGIGGDGPEWPASLECEQIASQTSPSRR
jgi:hypothetical protein